MSSYLNVQLPTVIKISHRPPPRITSFHLLVGETMLLLFRILLIKESIDILPVQQLVVCKIKIEYVLNTQSDVVRT